MSNFMFELFALLLVGSTIILASALLVNGIWRSGSAAHRCSIWQIAFIGVLLLPLLVCVLPTVGLGWYSDNSENSETEVASIETSATFGRLESPQVDQDGLDEMKVVPGADSIEPEQEVHDVTMLEVSKFSSSPQLPAKQIARTETQAEAQATTYAPPFVWQAKHSVRLLVTIWMLGCLYFLGRFLNANRMAIRIRKRARPINGRNASMANVVEEVSKTVPVLISNDVSTPSTIGAIAPCIVLPESSVDWDPNQTRMVLKHELAHIARRDIAWQWVSAIVRTICWFQPLAWIVEQRMNQDRECACDDRVVQNESACDYASALLAVAAEWSKQNWQLAGALSMAQKPIEKRLYAILEAQRNRSEPGRFFRIAMAVSFVLIAATISVVRPFDQASAFAVVESQDQGEKNSGTVEMVTIAEPLKGKIVDLQGKPVPDATAELTILPYTQWDLKGQDKKHKLPIAKCDANGAYTIDLSGFEVPKAGFKVNGRFSAPNRPVLGKNFSVRSTVDLDKALPDIKLFEGRIVKGKIVAPVVGSMRLLDPENAYIMAARGRPNHWFGELVAVEKDGTFELVIPKAGYSELIAGASNYAGIRVPLTPPEDDSPIELGALELKTGTNVSGVVKDAKGNPVLGAVVEIMQSAESASSKLDGVGLHLSATAKTGDDGKFQLSSQRGKCLISVVESGKNYQEEGYLKADSFPIVPALNIDLPTSGEKEVTLQAVPTITIRGKVRWLDGRPASGINVGSAAPGVSYSRTKSDEDGKYEVVFPKGDAEVHIFATSILDKNKRLFHPHPVETLVAKQKYTSGIVFENALTDIERADWVLRPDIVIERRTHTEADQALKAINLELSRDVEQFKKDYEPPASLPAVAAIASPPVELPPTLNGKLGPVVTFNNYLFTDKDSPFASYVGRLLKFEKANRGEFAALMSLRHILNWNDNNLPVAKEKYEEVVAILEEHYAEHKDLDLFAKWLVPRDDVILRNRRIEPDRRMQKLATLVRERNTDDRVQASMLYQSISVEAELLEFALTLQPVLKERPELAKRIDPVLVAAIGDLDCAEVLNSLKEKQRLIATKYPNAILSKIAAYYKEEDLCVDRDLGNIDESQTFAALAAGLIFEIESLQTGQPWPELKGTSVLGQPYDLSDEKGKVVVVFFSAEWVRDSHSAAYESMRDLKKKYAGQPFEVVTIMVDKKRSSAKKVVDDGEIAWPTIHDGASGPIATRWNITGLGRGLYLLDHTGKFKRRIRHEDFYSGDIDVEQIIANMVEAANNDGD